MSAVNERLNSAHKHLEAFEAWRLDHDTAMECYDLEDKLAEGAFVFDVIERANQLVRRAIYGGAPSDPEVVEACRALYQHWLRTAQSNLPLLDWYTATFESVRGASEYRNRIDAARRILAEWANPSVARAPGMHIWEVSDAEAAKLQALVKAPTGTPGTLSRGLKPMTEGDASIIR